MSWLTLNKFLLQLKLDSMQESKAAAAVDERKKEKKKQIKPYPHPLERTRDALKECWDEHAQRLLEDWRRNPWYTEAVAFDKESHPWFNVFHASVVSSPPDDQHWIANGFKVAPRTSSVFVEIGSMQLFELMVYLLTVGGDDRQWTFEEFADDMRGVACTDWNKCDINGEWAMDHEESYTDNFRASMTAMWQLPFPKDLLLFLVQAGCPQRDESVLRCNYWCVLLSQLINRAISSTSPASRADLSQVLSPLLIRDLVPLVVDYAHSWTEPDDMLFGSRASPPVRQHFRIDQWLRHHRRWWIQFHGRWSLSAESRSTPDTVRTVYSDCLLMYKQHKSQRDDPLANIWKRTGEDLAGLERVAAYLGAGAGGDILSIWSQAGDVECALRLMLPDSRQQQLFVTEPAAQYHWPFVTFDTVEALSSKQALELHPTSRQLLVANPNVSLPAVLRLMLSHSSLNRCLVLRRFASEYSLASTIDQISAALLEKEKKWSCTFWMSAQATHVWIAMNKQH